MVHSSKLGFAPRSRLSRLVATAVVALAACAATAAVAAPSASAFIPYPEIWTGGTSQDQAIGFSTVKRNKRIRVERLSFASKIKCTEAGGYSWTYDWWTIGLRAQVHRKRKTFTAKTPMSDPYKTVVKGKFKPNRKSGAVAEGTLKITIDPSKQTSWPEGRKCTTGKVKWKAKPRKHKGPDLVIKSVVVPSHTKDGVPFEVTITTQNKGKKRAKPTTTRLYKLPQSGKWGMGWMRLEGTVDVPGLDPKQTHKAKVTVEYPTYGPMTLRACADDPHEVKETNEHNNCKEADLQVASPCTAGRPPGSFEPDLRRNEVEWRC